MSDTCTTSSYVVLFSIQSSGSVDPWILERTRSKWDCSPLKMGWYTQRCRRSTFFMRLRDIGLVPSTCSACQDCEVVLDLMLREVSWYISDQCFMILFKSLMSWSFRDDLDTSIPKRRLSTAKLSFSNSQDSSANGSTYVGNTGNASSKSLMCWHDSHCTGPCDFRKCTTCLFLHHINLTSRFDFS